MSVPDNFIQDSGPYLVEASAGTGKTTWMVRTAVRLLLQDTGLPIVDRPERLLAVTFTRAATAELKGRLRSELQRAQRLAAGASPQPEEQWLVDMLSVGGERVRKRIVETMTAIDRLSVTTIHGFCKGVLEEFALECGVPVGLRFIEDDREYLDDAVADEWRTLTWSAGDISRVVMAERMSGEPKRANRWSPEALSKAARIVRQGIGAVRPSRVDRRLLGLPIGAALDGLVKDWNEARLRHFWSEVTWNAKGRTEAELDALCIAMQEIAAGREPSVAAITRWGRTAVKGAANGTLKKNKALLAAEPFLDACEPIAVALDSAGEPLWQDAVLSVVERVERTMRQQRVAGFDDMIDLLQRAVTDKEMGNRLREVLSSRYDAVLVDEFQDTDWAQWTIFHATFGTKPLILVGDPKQSIYGFRGADITAYRAAHKAANARGDGRIVSQDTNYRTDQPLVEATEKFFEKSSTPFGVEKSTLAFETVMAAHAEPTLQDAALKPMVLWDLGDAAAAEQDRRAARLIATEVARLLRDPSVRYRRDAGESWRPLKPSDISILVSANYQATPLLKALRQRRVPAVSGSTGDIVESASWRDLILLIAAIEDPSDVSVVRRALATSIAGYTARALMALESDSVEWRRMVDRLVEARHDWMSRGVLASLMRLTGDWGARRRLAAREDGERRLTDLRHAISLLQDAERAGHRNPTLLIEWARKFADESGSDRDRRQLHLESDADAVTISTMHAAKGLEWPVVFCGYLWKAPKERTTIPRVARFAGDARRIVFSGPQPDELPGDSALAENLRLSYVALTRARSRCYVVWARALRQKKGAIHHLLETAGNSPTEALAAEWPLLIARQTDADVLGGKEWPMPAASDADGAEPTARSVHIAASQLATWSVSSYTRFTRGLKGMPEAVETGPVDEAEATVDTSIRADQLPAGAHTGVALHALLERFDFTAVGDRSVLGAAIGQVLDRYALPRPGADKGQREGASDLVHRMMEATLLVSIPGAALPLSAVPVTSTLREWRFHLPMENVSSSRLATAFRTDGDEWIRKSYAPMLDRVPKPAIDGFLTGVVDLVAQIDGRWWIVDWKSNTLGASAAAYDAESCRRVMMRDHYVLQYHLYVVALHRFLRSRLGAAYSYERDFGGIGYAFLRGLALGAPAWFTDRPSTALIDALDAYIAGGTQ